MRRLLLAFLPAFAPFCGGVASAQSLQEILASATLYAAVVCDSRTSRISEYRDVAIGKRSDRLFATIEVAGVVRYAIVVPNPTSITPAILMHEVFSDLGMWRYVEFDEWSPVLERIAPEAYNYLTGYDHDCVDETSL